jgi:hypothetical protein
LGIIASGSIISAKLWQITSSALGVGELELIEINLIDNNKKAEI